MLPPPKEKKQKTQLKYSMCEAIERKKIGQQCFVQQVGHVTPTSKNSMFEAIERKRIGQSNFVQQVGHVTPKS
jgi:hypothetical protein